MDYAAVEEQPELMLGQTAEAVMYDATELKISQFAELAPLPSQEDSAQIIAAEAPGFDVIPQQQDLGFAGYVKSLIIVRIGHNCWVCLLLLLGI